jgi:transposase-like protein
MSERQRPETKDGRVRRWTAAHARTIIEQWKASGQSAVAFAGQHGIHAGRLAYWSKQLEQPESSSTAAFVAVPIEAAAATSSIEIDLDRRLTVRVPEGADTRYIVQLVAALQRNTPPC